MDELLDRAPPTLAHNIGNEQERHGTTLTSALPAASAKGNSGAVDKIVAQVSNLLFPIARTWPSPLRSGFGTPAGWKHCDTVGWKPALRSTDRTLSMALLSTSVWRFPQDPIAVGPRINAADALIFTLGTGDGRTLSIRGHFGRAGKDAATHL